MASENDKGASRYDVRMGGRSWKSGNEFCCINQLQMRTWRRACFSMEEVVKKYKIFANIISGCSLTVAAAILLPVYRHFLRQPLLEIQLPEDLHRLILLVVSSCVMPAPFSGAPAWQTLVHREIQVRRMPDCRHRPGVAGGV